MMMVCTITASTLKSVDLFFMHVELVFRFNSVKYEVEENDGFVSVDITFTYGIPGDYQL